MSPKAKLVVETQIKIENFKNDTTIVLTVKYLIKQILINIVIKIGWIFNLEKNFKLFLLDSTTFFYTGKHEC